MSKVTPVKLALNLREMFGSDFPDDEALRLKIGQRAIEMIRERTQEGLDKNGQAFPKYSASYVNSTAFKAAGKSEGEVNMTQFGDMLGLMDIIEQDGNRIVLGWDDETQNAKAFNHTTGDTVPRRDFMGLTKDQTKALRDEFSPEVQSSTRADFRGMRAETKEDRTILDLILELQDEL